MSILACAPVTALAAEEGDWPEPVFFPQAQQDLPPPPSQFRSASSAGDKQDRQPDSANKGFWKSLWPFGNKKDKTPPPTEAQIVNVGPRKTAPSPDPLLRLSMPIRTETGQIIPAGFYLLNPGQDGAETRTLTLIQQDKPLLKIQARPVKTAGNSPIRSTKPDASPVLKAESRLTPDQKAIIFVLTVGDALYESDPFPVATDGRPAVR